MGVCACNGHIRHDLGGGVKKVQICVTSFMNDPILIVLDVKCFYLRQVSASLRLLQASWVTCFGIDGPTVE